MFERVIEADKELFFILNGFHSSFMDRVMVTLSAELPWAPLYAAVFFSLFFSISVLRANNSVKPVFQIRRKHMSYALVTLAAVLVTFFLTENVSGFIKDTAMRFRPAYDPETGWMVRLLEHKGSLYGFVSSHAANTFGFAMITSLIVKRRNYSFFIFTWASLVSYSRIYVGKHYPADVVCGALLGVITALMIFLIISLIIKRYKIYP